MRKLRFELVLIAMGGAACGGPDIDGVTADFDHPSGSISDKDGLASAEESFAASGPAMSLAPSAGRLTPYGLTAAEPVRGLARLETTRLIAPHLAAMQALAARGEIGVRRMGLAELGSDLSKCYDPSEIKQSQSFSLSGSVSGSFSIRLDLGRCTDDVSGVLTVSAQSTLTRTELKTETELSFENVCETSGQKACVDGTLASRIVLKYDGGSIASSSSSLDLVQAYDLSTSWNRNNQPASARAKGGIRIKGGVDAGSIDYLVYAKDSAGHEVSYVMKVVKNADGSGMFSFQGKDGSLTCQVSAEGAGQCEGKLAWTKDDATLAAGRLR